MVELITEMLFYLGFAALLGLLLGYLFWGWGTAARISAARAEGAASARTSVDGSAGLREQLDEAKAESARQAVEIERLFERLARSEGSESENSDADSQAETVAEPKVVMVAPPDTDNREPMPDLERAIREAPKSNPDPSGRPVRDVRERFRTTLREQRAAEAANRAKEKEEVAWTEAKEETPDADASFENAESSTEPTLRSNAEPVSHQPDTDGETPTTGGADAPMCLFSERPDTVDDLKKIKGVGKVMERVLNEKGIYLFRQLAALDAAEIEWVNTAIEAFPGRIHRDRWVEQAGDLHRKKYGQAHDQTA